MMNKTIRIALTSATVLGALTATAYAYQGEQYASSAKLTMEQARSKALGITPGTVKDAELEKESGGSGLRYSFDIQTTKGLREVGIDAVTGKVLENSAESAQTEAQEAHSEHAQGSEDDRPKPAHEHEHEEDED